MLVLFNIVIIFNIGRIFPPIKDSIAHFSGDDDFFYTAADREQHRDTPCVVIADSVQTLHSGVVDAYPGSPSQIRYCGGALADFARVSRCPVFLVGHVTKTGSLAGPKLLEHMVDTVLYFEGSDGGPVRMIRAVKNRFGATGELAILEMRGDGRTPVDEAGALFLSGRRVLEPGSAVCAVRNGSRNFLVEVQALVSTSRYGTPQRVVQGVDGKRVALLAAILEKRAGLDLAGCDIFVKVAGGARLEDPAADLALLAALASSLREIPVPVDTLVLGCTHYPLLKDVIAEVMGDKVKLIDSGEEAARVTLKDLAERGLLNPSASQSPAAAGRRRFYVSDVPEKFSKVAMRFLGEVVDGITRVDISRY